MRNKMQWWPIDTAPDEGRFLVFGGKLVGELGDIKEMPDVPIFMVRGKFRLLSEFRPLLKTENHVFNIADTEYYACQVVNPTHWMPLPEPPEDEE